jgi:zinc protease
MKHGIFRILIWLVFPALCLSQVRPRPAGQRPTAVTPAPAYMQQLKAFDDDGPVTRAVLKNDLTLIIAETHASPLVEVMTWIKTGYRDDPADLAGITRVMERMFLRSTANRTATAMAADMKALGGSFRSVTAYDHTTFRTVAPAQQWKRALEIQSDALLNPQLDAVELKRQIELTGYEASLEFASPPALAGAKLLETGFAGDRLGQGPWGTAESLRRITREKLLPVVQGAYRPGRTLLVICGDVPTGEVLNAVVDLYGKAKAGASVASRPAPAAGPQSGFRYVQLRGNDRQARLHIGFHTAAAASSDYPALDVLRAMVATGEGAILNRRLKHQQGLVFSAAADADAFADTGYLRLSLELNPKDLDRCELAVFTELEILKRQEPDDAELERARAQAQREYWEQRQDVSGRAEQFARAEALGSWKAPNSYLERLGRIQWADIRRVAARYLNLNNCALLEYLPLQAESRMLSSDAVQNTIEGLLAPTVAEAMAEREKASVPAVEIPEGGGAFKPSEIRHSFQMASILRGPDLFIKEDHTTPLIHLGLFYAGGKLIETKANAGITSLLLRTLLRDSKTRSADQLYRQLEMYGATLLPVVEDDCFGLYLSIPSENIERGLSLVNEMIKTPKLDADEVARQKNLQAAALGRRSERALARQRVRQALFPDHSYALDPNGTEASLAAITPEAVQEWYRSHVAVKRPIVVIVGDTEGTSLAGYFVKNFSGSRFQETKLPADFPKPIENRSVAEESWGMGVSVLMMAFQAPPEGDEDSFPLMALQSYASDIGGRLVSRLQGRAPTAFRISLEYEDEFRGGSLVACAAVAPADEETALQVLADEIQRLATAPLTYREYRSAVGGAVGSVLIRQQDRFRLISDLIHNTLAGRSLEDFQDSINRLQEVKQPDLPEIAKRFFKMERSVTLRLRGKSAP